MLLSSSSSSSLMCSLELWGNRALSSSALRSSSRMCCWQQDSDPDRGVFIFRVSWIVRESEGVRQGRSTWADMRSTLNNYMVAATPYNNQIPMKSFNDMSKEEMREREREMKKRLMKETRELDREIFKVESMKKQAEDKLKKEIAKGPKADNFSKKTYARQMLQCQKNMERYSLNKAKIKNLEYQIDNFMANAKMAQIMGATGNLMAQVNQKINIQGTQMAMTKAQEEFMKMGLMNQMIDDALSNNDVDDMDIDEEAEKMLRDMELNVIKNTEKKRQEEVPIPGLEQPNELDDFEKRLNALK